MAVARNLAEAEEIQTILNSAGIPSELESAVDQHPTQLDDRRRRCSSPRARSRTLSTPSRLGEPDDLDRGLTALDGRANTRPRSVTTLAVR